MNEYKNIDFNINNQLGEEEMKDFAVVLATHIAMDESDSVGFCEMAESNFKTNQESLEFFMKNGELKRAIGEMHKIDSIKFGMSIVQLFTNTYKENFKKIKKRKGKVVLDIDKVPCNKTRILFYLEMGCIEELKQAVTEIAKIVFEYTGIKIKSLKIVGDDAKVELTQKW